MGTQIKPEDRFKDITFQNPTDWEAFDNLAKDHGIPTLADLKKGENYSAYLIKTDIITEPEPHPYQEILTKENLTKENRVTIKEKTHEKEITKEKIRKVEKLILNEEMNKTGIAEKITSTNENITQEIIHKKIIKQEDKITVGENQNLGIWTMKKGNAENPEQTQNNTENSKCNLLFCVCSGFSAFPFFIVQIPSPC